MTFANPHMLWLLLVIPPALLGFFWWSWRKRQGLLTQFIQARLLPSLTVGISAARQKIRLACLVLAVVCLILALARPQWGFDWEEVKLRGLDIVVAIDTSKSMLAEDIAPNRLARAKLAALDLMQQAKSDRLGLVAFAGNAFLQCPLTIDDMAFRQSVEALDVNTIPQGGTAIAEAIDTALTAFKEGENYKVLVLFTDGEDHDSGALEAAQKAAKEGLRIFTIGVGTAEGELLRVKDAQGNSDYIRDEQGNVVKSHLNETLLQQIASATEGGFYLPLRGAKTMDTLYEQGLAKLPKSQRQEKLIRRYHERYHWPLAAAIVLLLAEMLFPERKRERPARQSAVHSPQSPVTLQPAPPSPILHSPSAVYGLLCVSCISWLLLCPSPGVASPASALREYRAGKYDESLKEYERLLQQKSDDPRLHFNAGAAAYRSRQFEEAAKQFNATLASPDLKLQGLAYYNEGDALYHLGESNPDPKKRQAAWEKALTDYQSTMKLNPQDADAKFNYEFVKKKLEELKQQQQRNQQNKQDQNQDQGQQKQQQQQNQQKQDQQNQQGQQQQQQQQSQQNQSEQKKQDEQQQQQQAANQSQEQKEKQQQEQQQAQQSSGQPKDNSDEKAQEMAAAQAAGQMTPEQARQLLDAQKGDEQMMPPKAIGKPVDRSKPFKDW
jgi:Ca-activated chloride channel family protein